MPLSSRLLPGGFDYAAGLHLAQDLYPVLYRRVGGEEALRALLELLYGVDDVEVGGRAVGGLENLPIAADLLQGVGEALGVAGELNGAGVGEVLALAGDGELEETGEERGQDGEHDGDEEHDELELSSTLAPSPTAAAEPEA